MTTRRMGDTGRGAAGTGRALWDNGEGEVPMLVRRGRTRGGPCIPAAANRPAALWGLCGDCWLICPARLIASAIMLDNAGEGGTEDTEGVDMGEDCALYDAKDALRFFAGDGPRCEDGTEAGGSMGEGFGCGGV